MLVLISDLHFTDGTAGAPNVSAEASGIFFEDVAAAVHRLMGQGRRIDEIKIVLLGDIFDLLRSDIWFRVPEDERPWGADESKIEAHGNAIFARIVEANPETFTLWEGELRSQFDLPVEPERIYVPGNHDRLCDRYRSLRERVCRSLRIPPRATPFDHIYRDEDYGLLARHGHEFEAFNYEGSTTYRWEDYMAVPVGDPINTELLARLPWALMRRPEVRELLEAEQAAIRRNFEEIENVRPFSATIARLLFQVRRHPRLKRAIEEVVDQAIRDFNGLPFVRMWYDRHWRWHALLDEAHILRYMLFALEKLNVFSLEMFMSFIEGLKELVSRDDLLRGAIGDAVAGEPWLRHVVYGHSHDPRQAALRVATGGAAARDQVYLNTGTWRNRYNRSADGRTFIGWKNLSYVILYRAEERELDYPTFETWDGTMKKM
jgi:UDP-2,3-diacylglucosamine pyrophosphatase LpxH